MYRLAIAGFSLWMLASLSLGHSEAAPAAVIMSQVEPSVQVLYDIDPAVSAAAYAVIDIETGEVLFSKNGHTPLPIASVTKLFTAASVLEAGEQPVVVTAEDVATEGRAGKLAAGETYSTYELIYPLLLESSNDAATAIVRTQGLPQFAEVELADGSGLSSENRASGIAIAHALRDLYTALPHLFDITRLTQFIGSGTGWVNNSPVRELPGYRGGKHGYTPAAGRTAAEVFAESTLQERELGYVILGSSDIVSDISTLRAATVAAVTIE